MSKILVSTSSFDVDHNGPLASLREAGWQIVVNPHGRRLTEDEAIALLDGVVGMVAGTEPLTRRVLDAASALKVISRCGIGMSNVDLDAARERGTDVYNTPDAPSAAVAELTLGLMLAALRRIAEADRKIRNGKWQPLMGGLLAARTVGIVGFGRIGRKVALLARAFGATVIAHDVQPPATAEGVEFRGLEELLATADIVCLHLPSGAQTRLLLNRERIARMKKGAILVNTSRGDLVDERALLAALQDGRLKAAALDTFDEEPYSGPLRELENVVLTAHMGSYAEESRAIMEEEAARNLLEGLSARALTARPIAGTSAKTR